MMSKKICLIGLFKTELENSKIYENPKIYKTWKNRHKFTNKLYIFQHHLKKKNKFFFYDKQVNCMLNEHYNISQGYYEYKHFIWENGLIHNILEHQYKPNKQFIEAIEIKMKKYKYKRNEKLARSKIYKVNKMKFIKITKNQILILDALLDHGGFSKKYIDNNDPQLFRYSEHAGLLDFGKCKLKNIIMSANINTTTIYDNEIYFPTDVPNILLYQYVVHTHPPTPIPGGRINGGIMYEYPSLSDIKYFVYYSNKGNIQGSIVVASEGLYIIRRLDLNKKIKIDSTFDNTFKKIMYGEQHEAIDKYKSEFDKDNSIFFSKIAQDYEHINNLNFFLEKYNLLIIYFSRKKNLANNWYIDDIYLPVSVVELKK